MRELKFRAWDVESECYIDEKDWAGITPEGQNIWVVEEEEVSVLPILGEFIIEQYTGLKDKNGKEIYEGDIIHRGSLPKVNVFRNSVIRFEEESVGFIATSTRNGARTLFNGHTCDEIEVIGNIHENLELLGEEEE